MTVKGVDNTSDLDELANEIIEESDKIAEEILQEWQGWLDGMKLSAKTFCEVLQSNHWYDCPEALGITQEQFFEGINSISSLTLYMLIVNVPTVKHLWKGIGVNRYICPQWLVDHIESAMQDVLPQSCMAAPPPTQSDGDSSAVLKREIVDKCIRQHFQALIEQGD